MREFTPELGQMVFGNPSQEFELPMIWDAALRMLGDEIERVMFNVKQEPNLNPMGNTGYRFDCDTFSAHAYSWDDDDQLWNFKWQDVLVSWYKHVGRGASVNREVTPDDAASMLAQCMAAVADLDVDIYELQEVRK